MPETPMPETIIAVTEFPHAPARVWRALTDPAQLSRWLMPCDFLPVVGHTFTFDTGQWGLTRCEVLTIEPERLLRISWKNPPLDTTVTWTLEPVGSGTRLRVEHAGFDLTQPHQRFAFDGMKGGWSGMIAQRLAAVLAADGG